MFTFNKRFFVGIQEGKSTVKLIYYKKQNTLWLKNKTHVNWFLYL